MKKSALILSLVLSLVLCMTAMCFAAEPLMTIAAAPGTLEITGITPADGQKGLQPTNIAIKIEFSEEMSADQDSINAGKVTLTKTNPAEGEEKVVYSAANGNITLVHHEKSLNELWYIVDGTLDTNTEYTISVANGITAASGNTLGEGKSYTFSVRNTKTDSAISIVMMVVMMAIMAIATTKAAKKAAIENDPAAVAKAKEASMNPYKLAKEKNISLDEAKAIVAKEKAKADKEKAKAEEEMRKRELEIQMEKDLIEKRVEEAMAKEHAESLYHVKGPKSIKETGREVPKAVSKVKKARIEYMAEIARREAEERAAKSKGKKSKK